MSPGHEDFIVRAVPGAISKVVRLWDYVGLESIEDPIGQDLSAFVACRELMTEALEAWVKSEWDS
jgi:protein-tyrosine-phosphatase